MDYIRLLGLTSLILASAATAQQPTSNMGVLTCTLMASEKAARPISCGFKPATTGGEGRYVGTIREGGAALQGKQILVWTVIAAPEMKVSPEALAQTFSAKSDDPTKLVGKTNSSVMLQIETNPGANQRDAITEIELKLTSNPV